MPEPVISVRGEADLEVEPEIAIVWVSVQARDASRQRAVELLATRTGALSSTIKGFGEAVEKLESQPVNVQPVFKDGKPREKISGSTSRLASPRTEMTGSGIVRAPIAAGHRPVRLRPRPGARRS